MNKCDCYSPPNQSRQCAEVATHEVRDGTSHLVNYCDRCFSLFKDHVFESGQRYHLLTRVIRLLRSGAHLSDEGWQIVLDMIRTDPEFIADIMEGSTFIEPPAVAAIEKGEA